MNKTLIIFALCWMVILPLKAQLIDFDELETDSVSDIDGNMYKTILFDDTWWMAANLRTKHYNDGSEILQMTELINASDDDNNWSYWIGVGRWAYPGLDSTNFDTYGLLYPWHAAANESHGGICPEGWSLTDTGDWFDMARLIVDEDNIVWDEGTRNTPSGGTEIYYEVNNIQNVGRFLKSDNGELWNYYPGISSDCGASNMNIVPSGKLNTSNNSMAKLADYWTGCYVHSDSSGQGRRYINFEYASHSLTVNWNHNANMQCVRCVKHANIFKLASSILTLDSTASNSDTIEVTANYYWLAQTNSSWLSVSQTVDSADGKIIIATTSANTDYESRTDTVFVTMDDAKTKFILVTQAGKTPLFSISDTSLKIMANEGSITTFSVSSNVDWTINSSESWLSSNITEGSGNSVITLSAEANTDSLSRSATITIESSTADTSFEISVTQTAKTISSIQVYKAKENQVMLYPNPVNSSLNIFSNSQVLGADIMNLSGKTIVSEQNSSTIDVSGILPGLYIIKITTDEGVTVKKIVKQ